MRSPRPSRLPRVLVVDDDPVMRMLEQETLTQYEFEVTAAEDGETALDLLTEPHPDLVLLDVDMPGIDGFAVCRRIRENWDATEVPVIMVTGMDDLDSINQAYESGANDFISKPINWPILGYRARYVLRSAEAARSLRVLEEKQAAMMRAIPDMIFLFDRSGVFIDYKEGLGTAMYLPPEDFLGRRVADVLPAEVAKPIEQGIAGALDRGDLQSVEYCLQLGDSLHHYEARIAPSGAAAVVAVVRDITLQKQSEEKIRHMAYYDALTQMPNRVHFVEQLDSQLKRAREENRRLALLFLDLDGFKRINDTLGHSVGDELLKAVAERLRERLRAGDMVARPALDESTIHIARLGGDEFTVVLPDVEDIQVVTVVAQRVQAMLSQPFRIGTEDITVTSSIGIAIFPEHGGDAAALLKFADTAMYHAKDQGRNNWQLYSKSLTTKAETRLTLEKEIRRSLEHGDFRLYYQPQVAAEDGSLTGMEALLRWMHPDRGLVSPGEFIPVAEDSGLIVPLGEWVIREACRQLRVWQKAGIATPRVSVNLSARQLRVPGFPDIVARIIEESGIRGDMLEMELTESILMDPDAQRIEDLYRLRGLGVHFSIDDFGTGYSSMAYVKRFPIGMLKIDQSFVRGLPNSANDAAITTAIIAMARSLDLDVIAEGVETLDQRDFLCRTRCGKLQGYLFSPPVPPQAMEALLRQGRIAVGAEPAARVA